MIFKFLIIIIMLLFYVTYFLKQIRQKQKGIRTIQLGIGKIGITKLIETLVMLFSIVIV